MRQGCASVLQMDQLDAHVCFACFIVPEPMIWACQGRSGLPGMLSCQVYVQRPLAAAVSQANGHPDYRSFKRKQSVAGYSGPAWTFVVDSSSTRPKIDTEDFMR